MWTVSRMICMGVLAGASAVDIRIRKIPVWLLALANVLALCYQLCQAQEGKADVISVAGGIAIGLWFLFVSKVTEEGMGYGDSWAVLVLGIYLGMWGLVEVLAGAFLLLTAASMACMAARNQSKKARIPFFPFLAAGYLIFCLAGANV